jgi:hypothetical protein
MISILCLNEFISDVMHVLNWNRNNFPSLTNDSIMDVLHNSNYDRNWSFYSL